MTSNSYTPKIISQNDFSNPGFVKVNGKTLIPIYIANGLGFSAPGRLFLKTYLMPKLEKIGFFPLNPFDTSDEITTPTLFDYSRPYQELLKDWQDYGEKATWYADIEELLRKSAIVLALCEGYPVDEGMSAEIGYAAAHHIPIVGIRSDMRLGDMLGSSINAAVKNMILHASSDSAFFENTDGSLTAYEQAFSHLAAWAKAKLSS